MADLPPRPGSVGAAAAGPGPSSTTAYPGTPRWVKVSGIIVLVLVLLVAGVLLAGVLVAGGGQHGPGRHLPSGAPGDHAPPAAGAQWP
jgi:hypothetical protein